jgi:hypothetical protein
MADSSVTPTSNQAVDCAKQAVQVLRSQVVVQDEEIWTQKLAKNHKYILATATLNCLVRDINPKLAIDCSNRDIMGCMRTSVSDLQYTMLTNLLHYLEEISWDLDGEVLQEQTIGHLSQTLSALRDLNADQAKTHQIQQSLAHRVDELIVMASENTETISRLLNIIEPVLEQIVVLVNVTESILVKSKSLQDRQKVIDFLLILTILSIGYYMLIRFLLALVFLMGLKQYLLARVTRRLQMLLLAGFVINVTYQWVTIFGS